MAKCIGRLSSERINTLRKRDNVESRNRTNTQMMDIKTQNGDCGSLYRLFK